jgi:L-seryl-tRNA(Ser) seleniumtransferase
VSATDPRRAIPRTDAVLADERFDAARTRLAELEIRAAIAMAQAAARAGDLAPGDVVEHALAQLPVSATTLRRVLNATGVLLHTNLGRAPLSPAALDAIATAAGFADIEYDVVGGGRSQRGRGAIAALLRAVPEAQGALVVNNGAAALVLVATALAAERDIVISRGEMIEIGDGFRLPDLLVSTGAKLREVGTTNRTVLADYAGAVGEDTGFLLKVHPSNFVVHGFVASAAVSELACLPPALVVDIGSGLLRPDPLLPQEPDAATTLAAGADLVIASGDKLLGGPQAGIVLGRADLIEQLRRHPLARALRVDKLRFAALEATLRGPATPLNDALHADPTGLFERATVIANALRAEGIEAEPVASVARVGGGGGVGVELASAAVSLPQSYAGPLRLGDPAVIGHVERGRCLLDLRAIPPALDIELADVVRRVAGAPG